MDGPSLARTIDLAKRDFSLLLVDPKPKMVDWVAAFSKRKGLERYRLYYPEGNLVLVVPNLDRFSLPGQFGRFIDRMKPRLLEVELRRFTATPEDVGHSLSKETFDEFYDLSVRETAMLMADFGDSEELCSIGEPVSQRISVIEMFRRLGSNTNGQFRPSRLSPAMSPPTEAIP